MDNIKKVLWWVWSSYVLLVFLILFTSPLIYSLMSGNILLFIMYLVVLSLLNSIEYINGPLLLFCKVLSVATWSFKKLF